MPIGRFILSVVVAYILYAVLYFGTMMGVFADAYAVHADLMRSPEDGLIPLMYGAHLVQTIAIVWLFDKAVGSTDMKAGAIFGFWMGLYLAATDMTVYTGFKMNTDPMWLSVIIHLVVGMIVGVVLAKLYKAKDGAVPETS